MDQKKSWSFIGLFIIALVVSLPFYAADVYAVSVSVTGNHGEAGIEGFIDANGDTWTVEATIAGADEEVVPENVKVKIGGNEAEFDSCSEGVSGTVCEYVSLLDNGVNEDRYSFNVLYYLGAGGTASSSLEAVKADGSAPSITFNSIRQDGGEIKLDFSVSDEPSAYCVGLDKIEIIDAGDGAVLQTISSFEEKDCDFDFSESGGVLEVSLSGEGRKSLKIKAEDRLGHESSEFKSFSMDFAAPVIGDEIIFVDIGEFVGKHEVETDIKVNVTESGGSLKAKAYSEQAELDGDIVSCVEEDNWVCTWKDVSVSSSESISVRIVAEDGAGNTAEKTLRKSFAVDDSAPVAVFFGTERTFNGESYVNKGKNRIILRVDESGAGISEEGVRANLAGLGGGKFEEPDSCSEIEGFYECYWDTVKEGFSSDTVSIGLSRFEDKVGNEGKRPNVEVIVDTKKPAVKEIEVYGLGSAGQKDYFQSNDFLVVELEVEEAKGLLVLIDMNDLVMDADEKFSSFVFGDLGEYIGWAKFTEKDCDREEGSWICSLEVSEEMRSGYDSLVELAVEVYDTAGNDGTWDSEPSNADGVEGDFEFELLGLDVEEEPDFWEVKSVSYAPSFIDLDTVSLINTRMSAKVGLKASDAIARKIELVGGSCESEGGVELTRALLYGGEGFQEDKASATIVLEFETFDASVFVEELKESGDDTVDVPYTCKLNIYSQIGKKAIASAEEQEVELEVVFGFSELGAQDENLEDRVKEIIEEALFIIADKLKILNTVLQW